MGRRASTARRRASLTSSVASEWLMAHHHFAAEQIEYDGQVHPTWRGSQVRDVGHPFAIGSRRREVLGEDVRCRLFGRIGRCRGRREASHESAVQAEFSHGQAHGVAAGRFQLGLFSQRNGNLSAAIDAVRLDVNLPHRRLNPRVPPRARTLRTIHPGVVPRGGDFEYLAQRR